MKQTTLKLTAVSILAATLAACSTTMTAPPAGLLSRDGDAASPALKRAIESASPVRIDRAHATVGEVRWAAGQTAAIAPEAQAALLKLLRAELEAGLKEMPTAETGRPVVIRAAITRVEPVSPVLNVVSSLLLMAPWDRGGAATEIVAIDAETGQLLAATSFGYYPPMSDLKARFIKLQPAEIALKKAAANFLQSLTAPTAPSPDGRDTTPRSDGV